MLLITVQCDCVLCDKLGANGSSIAVRLYAVAPGGDEGNMSLTKINQYTSDSEDGMEDYIKGDWTSAVKKLSAVVSSRAVCCWCERSAFF